MEVKDSGQEVDLKVQDHNLRLKHPCLGCDAILASLNEYNILISLKASARACNEVQSSAIS